MNCTKNQVQGKHIRNQSLRETEWDHTWTCLKQHSNVDSTRCVAGREGAQLWVEMDILLVSHTSSSDLLMKVYQREHLCQPMLALPSCPVNIPSEREKVASPSCSVTWIGENQKENSLWWHSGYWSKPKWQGMVLPNPKEAIIHRPT